MDVSRAAGGSWEVEVADRSTTVACETLDDARRVAYLVAAHRDPCELIIRDEHQPVRRELIGTDTSGSRQTGGRGEARHGWRVPPEPLREDVEAEVRAALYGQRSGHIEIRSRS